MRIDTERFEVGHVVGSGGMGTVFRARDKLTGRSVAMKIMRGDSSSGLARFHRESNVLAHLEHPSIVRYIGHGTTSHGERFLVMEWLEGETLRARLARGGLSLAQSLALVTRVAGGLAEAHRAGIVHRDVKPSNIILPGGDVEAVKLVDFGVARWVRGGRGSLTVTGDVVGTPAYMAPEQARGLRSVTPAVDVFGLGCVFYECLAGRPPFVVSRHAGPVAPGSLAAPPKLRAQRPELPEPVTALVERMLARDPAARPADGAALHTELLSLASVSLEHDDPPRRPSAVSAEERTVAAASGSGSTAAGFAELHRDHGTAPSLSEISAQLVAVLARHVPLPMAVLRAQCERLGRDPIALAPPDLEALVPALVEAVARFVNPGRRSLVAAELRAVGSPSDPETPC